MLDKLKKDPLDAIALVFILFMVFSFVGWAYEMINDAICQGGWHWRSSLVGPWCPIYGIGGLLIVACFKKVSVLDGLSVPKKILRVILIAIGIYLLVTVVALAGSYIIEATMGYMPWDYSTSWGNFEGRIAPEFTIRFVIGGLFFLYLFEPVITKWAASHRSAAIAVAVVLAVLFVVDNALESAGVWADVIPRDAEVFIKQ